MTLFALNPFENLGFGLLWLAVISVYPASWLGMVPALRRARVSLAGRNLLTVTDYSGLDPEVSNFGNQPIARNFDIAPYPPSRSFWLALSAGF